MHAYNVYAGAASSTYQVVLCTVATSMPQLDAVCVSEPLIVTACSQTCWCCLLEQELSLSHAFTSCCYGGALLVLTHNSVIVVLWQSAGLEEGSIKHVPSTADLLNRLQDAGIPVPSKEVLRRRTASFLGSLENLQALSELETNTPTSDRLDAPFGSAKDSL